MAADWREVSMLRAESAGYVGLQGKDISPTWSVLALPKPSPSEQSLLDVALSQDQADTNSACCCPTPPSPAVANLALIFLLAWRPRKSSNTASGPIKY